MCCELGRPSAAMLETGAKPPHPNIAPGGLGEEAAGRRFRDSRVAAVLGSGASSCARRRLDRLQRAQSRLLGRHPAETLLARHYDRSLQQATGK